MKLLLVSESAAAMHWPWHQSREKDLSPPAPAATLLPQEEDPVERVNLLLSDCIGRSPADADGVKTADTFMRERDVILACVADAEGQPSLTEYETDPDGGRPIPNEMESRRYASMVDEDGGEE
jgi:hypothetical protein